jgi:hypothetical protein
MNFGKTALHVLETVAPTIAMTIGGPFGPIAAAAIHAALGTTDQKSAEAALISATPDQLLALKTAEENFLVQMEKLGIDKERLAVDDTANARAREIAVRDATPKILAYGTTVGFFLALLGLNLMPIPAENRATIYSMVGSLGTVWILVMGYYFGSSRGSDDKTKVIADIAKQS